MNNNKPTNHLIERALSALRKEYVVVGKTYVRAWHAWLTLGIVVGIVAGVVFVANRSGEFETTKAAGVFTKDNGIIRINLNEGGYPMITSMYITGIEVLSHDNAGADFQITSRRVTEGASYNPTQGGDCTGSPSRLTGYLPNWTGGGLDIDPQNGILLGVDPRNYNEFSGSCHGQGAILPYDFNFGVTLGDDAHLPKQMMIIDMSIRREEGSEVLAKRLSEVPVAFPKTSFMRYAYFSRDGQTFDTFRTCLGWSYVGHGQWACTGGYRLSNDVSQWAYGELIPGTGRAVMLCNIPDALERPDEGICMAFYSHFDTLYEISRRRGGEDLTLVTMVGHYSSTIDTNDPNQVISDFNWHTLRRIMAVGNVNTVKAVISIANQRITDWGNWRR